MKEAIIETAISLALAVLVITGFPYYYLRRWQLRRLGISIEDKLSKVQEY